NSLLKKDIYIRTLDGEQILNPDRNSIAITDPEEIFSEFNNLTEKIIGRFVKNGSVNYSKIRLSPEYKLFQNIAGKLADFDLDFLETEDMKKSFWINLYNMMVIDFVLKMKVNRSVREIQGFFTGLKYTINGKNYSLADIENILRCFPDRERLILSLVKGTQSSPPLRFISPMEVEDSIQNAVKDFINGPEVMVFPEENALLVSELFRWNRPLFMPEEKLISFIKEHIIDERKREFLSGNNGIKVDYLFYDWYLNS
ncbi:DUF547 domain-containing protein, partial [Persephonella sp.]